MLTIQALKGFAALVEEGSFSGAARRLGLTQPAVSAHVRTLEEHFGQPLMERAGRSWRPTAAGERLYGYAAQVAALAETMEDALAALGEEPAGHLRVAASTVPGEFLLPRLLGGFCGRYPGVRVSVEVADSSVVVDQVLHRRCDVGVIGAPLAPDRLELTPFASDTLVLVAPPGHPLAGRRSVRLDDLLPFPFVMREEGSGTRSVVAHALMEGGLAPERLRVAVELGSTESVKRAVQAGVGLSFVSVFALRPGEVPGEIAVVKLRGFNSERPLYVAVEAARPPRNTVEAFRRHLTSREVVGRLREWRSAWRPRA